LKGAVAASATASLFTAAILGPVLLTVIVIALLCDEKSDGSAFRMPAYVPWIARGFAIAILAHSLLFAHSEYALARLHDAPSAASMEQMMRERLPGATEDVACSRLLGNSCGSIMEPRARFMCQSMALRTAAAAVDTADDAANAWYNLAIFTASQQDVSGTERALRRAIEIAPNWFKPHWTLARMLQLRGEHARALEEATRASILANNRYPEVRYTLEQLERQ
jgi:hypothetical protein